MSLQRRTQSAEAGSMSAGIVTFPESPFFKVATRRKSLPSLETSTPSAQLETSWNMVVNESSAESCLRPSSSCR